MSTFHIRDTKTGKFYSKFRSDWNYDNQVSNPYFEYASGGFGKGFKELGKVKTHLLYLIGIMLPPPDWLYNPCPIDSVPDTWEIVEIIDKSKKEMTVLDLNPSKYVDECQRLRVLTDTYGSAVKEVYKKLEKTNKLNELKYVAAISINIDNIKDQSGWIDYDNMKLDIGAVDEAIKAMGIKRSEMVRASKGISIAIAFKDQETAVWFSFTYGGSDIVKCLDMEKLEEIVQEK